MTVQTTKALALGVERAIAERLNDMALPGDDAYFWPTDPDRGGPKVAYLKRWTWQCGHHADGTPVFDSGWSLHEGPDYAGYVDLEAEYNRAARRLRLRGRDLHAVVQDCPASSVAELPVELLTPI